MSATNNGFNRGIFRFYSLQNLFYSFDIKSIALNTDNIGFDFSDDSTHISRCEFVLDCIKDKFTPADMGRIIRKVKPDVVGVQCYTFDVKRVKQILEAVKSEDASIKTIVGGAHVSSLPQESFEHFYPY